MFWIGFFVGLILGVICGFVLTALFTVSADDSYAKSSNKYYLDTEYNFDTFQGFEEEIEQEWLERGVIKYGRQQKK